jgi:hypothetical protein
MAAFIGNFNDRQVGFGPPTRLPAIHPPSMGSVVEAWGAA